MGIFLGFIGMSGQETTPNFRVKAFCNLNLCSYRTQTAQVLEKEVFVLENKKY